MPDLRLHPDSLCSAIASINVEAVRSSSNSLKLRYLLIGDIGALRLPPIMAHVRMDNLWQHTCFEAFVQASGDETYHEFNFAPSTEWAAYRFRNYRDSMKALAIDPPVIATEGDGDRYQLHASLDLSALIPSGPWRLGLSTVIEEANGRKSYWALAHPTGEPDFHHPDCFVLQLPPA